MATPFAMTLDRSDRSTLSEQIQGAIGAAILEGRVRPGARLPSWRDLAARLGVARGTVRAAYERLVDLDLAVADGPRGTHVAQVPRARPEQPRAADPIDTSSGRLSAARPAAFQMGVPAQDAFPSKAWSRILAGASRTAACGPLGYPDPRGEPELRHEIAANLAVTRGLACAPSQVIVTGGYAGALGLILRTLCTGGECAWMEDPGYPLARRALELAHLRPVPVPVDAEGMVVDEGMRSARDAALAIVTPAQQAPLGAILSQSRRRALIDWAGRSGAWIVEDDYLGELRLVGRAPPALAAMDGGGRVIHAGTFSKTISPALRLGFVVVPNALGDRFCDVAASMAPAPGPPVQLAVAAFLREGHYLRHLRRMKRLYAARRAALLAALGQGTGDEPPAGLAVLLRLRDGAPDAELALAARAQGLAPMPLSAWYAGPVGMRRGLLLGLTNASGPALADHCARLRALVGPWALAPFVNPAS